MAKSEARLNLVITARDDAKRVIEAFAQSIRASLESVHKSVQESLNMNGAVSEVDRATGKIKSDLESIGNTAKETKKAIDFQNLQFAGQQFQAWGQSILGFFGQAIHSAADFDQSIHNATASLNANRGAIKLSSKEIENMSNLALKMGSDGFFSANQIAEAMNTMAKQGIDYQTIMQGGIETVKNVAAANQQDLEQTANVVSDIYNEMSGEFKAMGLNVQQSAQMIGNSMTVALHHARISMDDFMNTMKYVGPQAASMGVSIKDVSAAIALLGEHGIRGTQAGTTLRTMLTNLQPTSKAAAEKMRELGMITKDGANIFFDSHGKMLPLVQVQEKLRETIGKLNPEMQQQAIKTIFGRYALAGMTAIIGTSNDKFKELTKEMGNNNIMTDIMNEKKKGLGMQIQALNAHFQTIMKTIGMELMPVTKVLVGALQALMKGWDSLGKPMQTVIVTIGLVIGVVMTLGGAFMTVVGTIGMLSGALEAGFAALGAAMAPIGIVVAAIAGVIAVIYLLKKAWDANLGGIQQKTQAVWNWVKQQFQAAMNYIMPIVNGAVQSIIKWWNQMAPSFEKAIHNIYAAIMWLSPVWKAIWEVIKFVVKIVFDNIVDTIKHAVGLLSGILQFFVHLFSGEWGKLWNDTVQILENAVMLFLDLFKFKFVGKGLKFLEEFGTGVAKWVVDLLRRFKSWADGTTGIVGYLWNLVKGLFNAGMKFVSTLWRNGWSIIQNIFGAFKNLFTGNVHGFWNNINGIFRGAVGIIRGIMSSWFHAINSILGGLPAKALSWARNMMDMFIHGIQSKISGIVSAVSGVANKIKSFLGFHSPAEEGPARKGESDQWMPNMMAMFERGIIEHTPKIEAAINGVALGIKTGITQVNHHVSTNQLNVPAGGRHNHHRQTIININIEGRSHKTDNDLAETIAKKIYTQMTIVS